MAAMALSYVAVGNQVIRSRVKRSIVGTFYKMSVKHMDRYLEELEWRFNNRDNPHFIQDALKRIVNIRKHQEIHLSRSDEGCGASL